MPVGGVNLRTFLPQDRCAVTREFFRNESFLEIENH